MFSTTVSSTFLSVAWTFNNSGNIIIQADSTGHVVFTGQAYVNRTTFNTSPTVSLELRNLMFDDSGEYTVTFYVADSEPLVGTTKMIIYGK